MQESRGTETGGPSGFAIAVERDPLGVHVTISGELDIATVPELDRVLDELSGNGYDRVLIDLGGVQFIDSTGLASIVRAHVNADHDGHRITVRCGDSHQARRLLELTGMLDKLNLED